MMTTITSLPQQKTTGLSVSCSTASDTLAAWSNPEEGAITARVNRRVHIGDFRNAHINQYVFCDGNPVNFVDPWGLWTEAGHNKLGRYGGNKFDYARLDKDRPATLSSPEGHFSDYDEALIGAYAEAVAGNHDAFEYAMHELQDYFSHRGAGVTTPYEHVKKGTTPDNPRRKSNIERYKEADRVTRMLEDIWDKYNDK